MPRSLGSYNKLKKRETWKSILHTTHQANIQGLV